MPKKEKLKDLTVAAAKESAPAAVTWKPAAPPAQPVFGLEFKAAHHGPIKSVTTSADGSQHIEFHYPVK